MAEAGAGANEVAANRELWTQANSEYNDEHAYRAWAAEDITWGIFNVPEQQLGCSVMSAALMSSSSAAGRRTPPPGWPAAGAAGPGGRHPASSQSARRCQDRFGISFPLLEADAGDVPLPPGSFDLAISECGASLWCDPAAGYPRLPGCCDLAGNWSSTPPPSWSPCAPRGRTGPPARNCSTRSARHTAWQLHGEGYSSTPATASRSRSCATAASSSTRCASSTPRRMLPIIPTTHWRAPNGRASGRPRNMGHPPHRLIPTVTPRAPDRRLGAHPEFGRRVTSSLRTPRSALTTGCRRLPGADPGPRSP